MAVLTANPSQKSTKRYPFLDELRGAAILMMIAYHLLYDGVVFAGWDIPLFSSAAFHLAGQHRRFIYPFCPAVCAG